MLKIEIYGFELWLSRFNESCWNFLLRIKEYVIIAIQVKLITHKTKGEKCGGQIS